MALSKRIFLRTVLQYERDDEYHTWSNGGYSG